MPLYKLLFIVIFGFGCISTLLGQSLEEREWLQRGNDSYAQKEWDLAISAYSQALTVDPNSVKGHYNLGNALYEKKQYQQAVSHYQQAIKWSENTTEKHKIYHNLGNAFLKLKKYKPAIEAYKNALRNEPSDNQTRYNLALAKKLLEDEQQNKKEQSPPLPKPSEFAKKLKIQADEQVEKGAFLEAVKLMKEGLQKDSTVLHYQSYIQKLDQIVAIDTLSLK